MKAGGLYVEPSSGESSGSKRLS